MNDYNDRIKKGFAIMNGVHGYEHAFIEDQPFEEADPELWYGAHEEFLDCEEEDDEE